VVTTAKCIDRPVFYFCQAAFGIFTDLATVLCPIPVLRDLKMRRKQKIAVGFMLTMGGFVCIVSIIRLQSLYVLLTQADLTSKCDPYGPGGGGPLERTSVYWRLLYKRLRN
jgi:hypothetical protein